MSYSWPYERDSLKDIPLISHKVQFSILSVSYWSNKHAEDIFGITILSSEN